MKTESTALSGLPAPFLDAMRKLFDIMDCDRVGWIHIDDIAHRWQSQEASNPGLPKNVVQNLRKVMNKEGRLSFERFCAGLKISILRHEAERNRVDKRNKCDMLPGSATSTDDPSASSSNDEDLDSWSAASAINRAASLPNLSAVDGTSSALSLHPPPISSSTQVPPSPVPSEPCLGMGPPKPPRDPLRMSARDLGSRCADHGMFASQSHAQLQREGPQYSSGRRVKRRDSHLRRHTLQGGVDFSMMKRLKHWEFEKSSLESGIKAIEKAREVYEGRLREVTDRLKFGQVPGSPSVNSEVAEERTMFELRSIHELNQRLDSLSARNFPAHMNLEVAVHAQMPPPSDMEVMARQIQRLKEQNRMLTEEVGRKCNGITNLEQEKSVLIRQLFQARSLAAGSASGVGAGTPSSSRPLSTASTVSMIAMPSQTMPQPLPLHKFKIPPPTLKKPPLMRIPSVNDTSFM